MVLGGAVRTVKRLVESVRAWRSTRSGAPAPGAPGSRHVATMHVATMHVASMTQGGPGRRGRKKGRRGRGSPGAVPAAATAATAAAGGGGVLARILRRSPVFGGAAMALAGVPGVVSALSAGDCQATVKTAPPATSKTDPLVQGGVSR